VDADAVVAVEGARAGGVAELVGVTLEQQVEPGGVLGDRGLPALVGVIHERHAVPARGLRGVGE
jgi:hypothetical protein